jgi:Dyp-type peroxidase family
MTDDTLERDDVQGLLVRGYGQLRAARYLLGEIVDATKALDWLGRLDVASGAPGIVDVAVNVAFTASGLSNLGLPGNALGQFSREFVDGMVTEHRQRILGDVDDSAPEFWDWGAPGADPIDVLLLVFARDDAAVRSAVAAQERALGAGGIRLVRTLDTVELGDREHFGFRDGISQPRFKELGPAHQRDVVATGELVLGYPNAYKRFTPRPIVDDSQGILPEDAAGSGKRDLGRNGTYLVFRQLSQDVRGFWDFCERATRRQDGSVDEHARVRVAAKLVGRWPSGAPLALAPEVDRPRLEDANDFAYFHVDPHGLRCPLGSHVRRANPRDTLDPAPGTQRSVEVNKRHRLLRRGRNYGALLPVGSLLSQGTEASWGQVERGLHFICLVGNIARQFEFVQHSWLNDPRFNCLYDHPDALLSPAPPNGRTFTVQAEPVRERYSGLPRFVSVRGGAYFFLPGVRALRHLATLPH